MRTIGVKFIGGPRDGELRDVDAQQREIEFAKRIDDDTFERVVLPIRKHVDGTFSVDGTLLD